MTIGRVDGVILSILDEGMAPYLHGLRNTEPFDQATYRRAEHPGEPDQLVFPSEAQASAALARLNDVIFN